MMTNEISQTHKDKYCLFSFYVNPDLNVHVCMYVCVYIGEVDVGYPCRSRRQKGDYEKGGKNLSGRRR